MTVLQVCAFAAPNGGNFISSLTCLENELRKRGIETIYAFADGAEGMPWCEEIQKRTKVYFLPTAKARILPKTYRIMKQIYRENRILIAHSHFELYDIPTTTMAPEGVKVFWHLHDPINPGKGLHSILWKFQYGVVSKRAKLLAVADYYREAVVKMGFPEAQTSLILNAIDLGRIQDCRTGKPKTWDFLTFGWDFFRKGDDLILQACKRLADEGYHFRLLLNGNEKTWPVLDDYLGGACPAWLVRGEPVSDVNQLFASAGVFIQASRRETFSYAVCEAAYAGMPVISSDIAGLEWAHVLPSVTFFDNENAEQLYQIMKRYLDGAVCAEKDVMHSQELIRENYSLESWTKRIIEQYQLD